MRTGTRLVALITMTIIALVAFSIVPAEHAAAAQVGPHAVSGIVYDSGGNVISGASVTVTVVNKTSHLQTFIGTTSTDGSGFYVVTVDPNTWDVNDTIGVRATFNSNQATNSTPAIDGPFQTVDVHFTLGIPQFGSLIGFGVAGGLIGTVAIVFLRKKR